MTVYAQLSALESADLIQMAQTRPDLEYLFRHALVQDAAYGSLLKNTRRELHQAVGAVLETLHAPRPEEVARILAYHFDQAGDEVRALRYLTMAADSEAGRYAIAEAILHYDRAIAI